MTKSIRKCCLKPLVNKFNNQTLNVSFIRCDDFYAYSCNQWIKNNPIPDGKSMWGTFGKLEQQNQLVVKNVLERNISEYLSSAEKKAKMYYESCMDTDEIMEKLGAKPMLSLLKEIGGWNVTNTTFNVTKWTLQKVLQKLHNTYNMVDIIIDFIIEKLWLIAFERIIGWAFWMGCWRR